MSSRCSLRPFLLSFRKGLSLGSSIFPGKGSLCPGLRWFCDLCRAAASPALGSQSSRASLASFPLCPGVPGGERGGGSPAQPSVTMGRARPHRAQSCYQGPGSASSLPAQPAPGWALKSADVELQPPCLTRSRWSPARPGAGSPQTGEQRGLAGLGCLTEGKPLDVTC